MEALEEKKAVDPVVVDIHDRTVMTDYFIVASGTSRIQINALIDGVVQKLADLGIKNKRVESGPGGQWTLIDYGDVIVHVLSVEQREFYKLESYWSGAEAGSPPLLES